jgi:tRNA(Ile)-lysidine synthase
MLYEFLKYVEDNRLVRKGDRVLLAVSGGIDSMVMADLFSRTGIEFGIAHCNFCLRGSESDKDESLVRKFAALHKVPFYSEKFRTEDYAEKNGISIQMAARELRYRWFDKIRRRNRFSTVAIAHNMNDNIETLLINLTRGTGIAGLTGMKPAGDRIIRPLLFATRETIAEYCKNRRIKFREDKSNEETKYTRNKIRHLVIPVLKEINPSIELTLNETAERMSGVNEILNLYIDALRNDLFIEKNDILSLGISAIKPYFSNKTIIYELFRPYGITRLNLKDLYKIIAGRTGGQLITGSHRIIKNRQEILVEDVSGRYNEFYKADTPAELKKVSCIESVRIVSITGTYHVSRDNSVATLDYDKVSFPLIVRRWYSGDFFYPFGMKKKKKLSDYFIDRKFSRIDKEKALIIESEGRIVWIIGERIDNRFRITDKTNRGLIIEAKGCGLRAMGVRD